MSVKISRWIAPATLSAIGLAWLPMAVASSPARATETTPAGVVVVAAPAGGPAATAGIRVGDVLLRWRRDASPPANTEPASGSLGSPFDLSLAVAEEMPRGPFRLSGTRAGEPFDVPVPPGYWSLVTRPSLAPSLLDAFQAVEDAVAAGNVAGAVAHARRLIFLARDEATSTDAVWAQSHLGDQLATAKRHDEAETAYREAIVAAEAVGDPAVTILLLRDLGRFLAYSRYDGESAAEAYRRAGALAYEMGGDRMIVANVDLWSADAAFVRQDYAAARETLLRSATRSERLAPASFARALAETNLGTTMWRMGDFVAAEAHLRRAEALSSNAAPRDRNTAAAMLALVARVRGDLATAERIQRAVLANQEAVGTPQAVATAQSHLAGVLAAAGKLDEAETLYEAALTTRRAEAPEGHPVASTLGALGGIAMQRGDVGRAQSLFEEARVTFAATSPGGVSVADMTFELARLAARRERPGQAEALVRQALTDRLMRTPDALPVARMSHFLGGLLRDSKRPTEALEAFRTAVTVLEAQTERLGGTDEQRVGFAAQWGHFYRDLIALEMAMGHAKAAFHTLERSRARQLLELLRQRRIDIEQPAPLDLTGVHAALDAGTLLLSYSIGPDASWLFAVGPGSGDFRAVPLAVREADLAADVETLRSARSRRSPRQRGQRAALRRKLSTHVLSDVADLVVRADRVLVVADGALHFLPFAALDDPAGPGRLIERLPVFTAASATVFAALKRTRRAFALRPVVAFGDPRYGAARAASTVESPRLARALDQGLDLAPLPSSRIEAEAMRAIYGDRARLWLGPDATEARAKAIGADAGLVDFACHAVIDDRMPLESSLVLSLPGEERREGDEDGLLQAWEIFEQVKLDADLVTLSACDTGLGTVRTGEGLLGLTRAFHDAGARSVLAARWRIGDETTAILMRHFYEGLHAGLPKAEALRAAQLSFLREPVPVERDGVTVEIDASDPFHWAAFQLVGDWR